MGHVGCGGFAGPGVVKLLYIPSRGVWDMLQPAGHMQDRSILDEAGGVCMCGWTVPGSEARHEARYHV